MAAYAAGDPAAFGELFRRYEGRVYGFFLRRTGSPQRAQDLFQELFLRIHRSRDRYDPSRPFPSWLFRIAQRLVIDDRRRSFRSHEVAIEDREAPDEGAAIDARLGDGEQAAGLLAQLSAEERHAVVCAKIDGIGYVEIAEQLGKSTDAVKKMVSRALQRLRGRARPAPVR